MAIEHIGPEESGRISLEKAEDGDVFGLVVYHRWSSNVINIFTYTVTRALKRDVLCIDQYGQEVRFRRDREVQDEHDSSSAYANINSPVFKNFYDRQSFEKRRIDGYQKMKAIQRDSMDVELVDAIEAYLERVKKNDTW